MGITLNNPPTPLFGAAALSAIAAAAALALTERKRRKDEEARQAEEAQRKAAARNAAEAMQRIQNWLIGQQIKKMQEEAARKKLDSHRGADAKIDRMEAVEEYMARLEDKLKAHYRRPSDDQPPPDAVIIPPLTAKQLAELQNWNVAAQVGVYGITIGLTAGFFGAIGSRGGIVGAFIGGVIGAVAGAMWGAYEVSCIASVQDEFEEAYKQSGSVAVWRDGWKFNVDANSRDGTYTQANGPLSALYVAGTTLILSGKIP